MDYTCRTRTLQALAKAIDKDGKFIDLAESEEFINHLKDIGITHIQILPSFDYAEENEDSEYNWVYNPYHYNVPEGRYVKDMKDGSDAVKQFRQFIKAIHDAGIAVNMDVVYNHTNGTQTGSLYHRSGAVCIHYDYQYIPYRNLKEAR